jgi:hypothetical protein
MTIPELVAAYPRWTFPPYQFIEQLGIQKASAAYCRKAWEVAKQRGGTGFTLLEIQKLVKQDHRRQTIARTNGRAKV